MKYAEPGSVSHGTLRTEDLLPAFASTLEALVQDNAEEWCSQVGRSKRDHLMRLIGEAREWEDDGWITTQERGGELVEELIAGLNMFSPPGTSFTTNEGDGSDFGYWPAFNPEEF